MGRNDVNKHLNLGQPVRQLKVESKALLALSLFAIELTSDRELFNSSFDQLFSFENRLRRSRLCLSKACVSTANFASSILAVTRVYVPRALQYAVKIKDNAVIHRGPRCGAFKRMVNKLHSNDTLGIGQNNCSYWGQLPIGPLKSI